MPHISLAAETVGAFWGFRVTNSLLMTWVVMAFLTTFSLAATRKLTLIPSKLQSIAEVIVDGMYGMFKSITGDHIDQFFPLLATIFLFVIVGNWIGLLPGVGSIGFHHGSEFTPLFRGPTADLNTTLAIALIAVGAIQFYGFKNLGATYGSKFINFKNPIYFFIGILEIVSDLSKVISFAFRLFGNVFAGEVLLTVIAFLMPLIAPLPFLGLEIFVGFVQALVFSMLTAVFLNMAVAHEEH